MFFDLDKTFHPEVINIHMKESFGDWKRVSLSKKKGMEVRVGNYINERVEVRREEKKSKIKKKRPERTYS